MHIFSFRSRQTKAHRIPVALLSGLMMVAACGGSPEDVDGLSDEQQTAAPSEEAAPREETAGNVSAMACNPFAGECWTYLMIRTYVPGARGLVVNVEQAQEPYLVHKCVPDIVGQWAGSGIKFGHEAIIKVTPVYSCTNQVRVWNYPTKTFGPMNVRTTGGNYWLTY